MRQGWPSRNTAGPGDIFLFSLVCGLFYSSLLCTYMLYVFFLRFLFIYLFLEREREGEREGEKQCVVASHVPPTGDMAHNPGMCPDWELNR